MTHPITIDDLEKEIEYLREQNQKLIKELSQVVKENIGFREEIALERRRVPQIPGEVGEKDLNENNHNRQTGREKGGDLFCLN